MSAISHNRLVRTIAILLLNLILIAVLYFSKDTWFSEIERQSQISNIVLTKESELFKGGEIIWEIRQDEKVDM